MKDRKINAALEALSQGGRILVSRLQYLGDVILTLPLVETLKRRFPNCEIDYLTKEPAVDLLGHEPVIDTVHCVPGPGEGKGATYRLIRQLRKRHFNLAIDLLSNPRSALLVFSSGASVRLGGLRRIRKYLYTHNVRVPGQVRSAVAHHLYSLRVLGIEAEARKPAISVSYEEIDQAKKLLCNLGVKAGKILIGLHPGGKWEVKRWPVESFAALASRIKHRLDAEVIVFRGPGEDVYTDRLRAIIGEKTICLPGLSVRKAAAVMHELDAGVYCDGGAMHLSVAVGTPTVGIFGSSEPDVWFPYESFGPFRPACVPVDCRPCHVHTCDHLSCLMSLSVEMVEQKLSEVLNWTKSTARSGDFLIASDG